ncbi:type II toxin-antitoxin system VapC family toxin [Thermococcus sp.]
MENLILDTYVVIDFLRGKRETIEKLKELRKTYQFIVTTITAFELYLGAYRSQKRGKRLLEVKAFLNTLLILELDEVSAEIAGKIATELSKDGEPIDVRDLLIGSIAISHSIPLLTNNVKHFERLKKFGLKLLGVEDANRERT